jgi:hypothetical protein
MTKEWRCVFSRYYSNARTTELIFRKTRESGKRGKIEMFLEGDRTDTFIEGEVYAIGYE